MKKIIGILIISSVLGCSKYSNTFKDIAFGKTSKKSFLKEMINNKTFIVFKDDKDKPSDTTDFGYVLRNGNKEFPMRPSFNEGNEKYDFGVLRRMTFTIGEDTEEDGYIWRKSGKIPKEFVDDLFDTYVDIYGKPDSLKVVNKYTYDDFFEAHEALSTGKEDPKNIDKNYISGKRAIWNTTNFNLIFEIPALEKPTSEKDKIYYQKDGDFSISIVYEMKDYDKEFKRIQDSIAKTLTPNDLVYINTGDCEWSKNYNNVNDTRLKIKLTQITRRDQVESKSISGVRFDLIIKDSFKKELYKIENLTIELPREAYLEGRSKKGSLGQTMYVDLNNTYYWDFNSYRNSKLAFLKKYSENNKVIIYTQI